MRKKGPQNRRVHQCDLEGGTLSGNVSCIDPLDSA